MNVCVHACTGKYRHREIRGQQKVSTLVIACAHTRDKDDDTRAKKGGEKHTFVVYLQAALHD